MNYSTLQWTARILGGLAVVFFGIFAMGEGTPDLFHADNMQLKALMTLLVFAAFGYFFSWFKEKEGGIVLSVSGVLLGMNVFYSGGMNDMGMTLIYMLPFLVPGLMFWWLGTHKNKKEAE